MRQVQEVLRLKWGQGLSERKIAQSLCISRLTVAEYVRWVQAAGLSWPLPTTYDEGALEWWLFPSAWPEPLPHTWCLIGPRSTKNSNAKASPALHKKPRFPTAFCANGDSAQKVQVIDFSCDFSIMPSPLTQAYNWLCGLPNAFWVNKYKVLVALSGIRLRRDSWVLVRDAEGLHSSPSSATHQKTDRHEIVDQKPADFPRSL